MNAKIKVSLGYRGAWKTNTSQDYKIEKIVGAPTVEVSKDSGFIIGRVGDLIDEKQATELATRVEVTTTPYKK
jgi:hypothetical protein